MNVIPREKHILDRGIITLATGPNLKKWKILRIEVRVLFLLSLTGHRYAILRYFSELIFYSLLSRKN